MLLPSEPVCLIHGLAWREHAGGRCLFCCLCFRELTVEECHVQADGTRIDVCDDCAAKESAAHRTV